MTQEPGHLSRWRRWSLQVCHRHFRSLKFILGSSNSLSATSTAVTLHHQTAAHSSVKHLRSERTIYNHNRWTSELITETDSKSSWSLSLSPLGKYSQTGLCDSDATWNFTHFCFQLAKLVNIEMWQVPYRSWISKQLKSFMDRQNTPKISLSWVWKMSISTLLKK